MLTSAPFSIGLIADSVNTVLLETTSSQAIFLLHSRSCRLIGISQEFSQCIPVFPCIPQYITDITCKYDVHIHHTTRLFFDTIYLLISSTMYCLPVVHNAS